MYTYGNGITKKKICHLVSFNRNYLCINDYSVTRKIKFGLAERRKKVKWIKIKGFRFIFFCKQ